MIHEKVQKSNAAVVVLLITVVRNGQMGWMDSIVGLAEDRRWMNHEH
jgi:hypothetical protein